MSELSSSTAAMPADPAGEPQGLLGALRQYAGGALAIVAAEARLAALSAAGMLYLTILGAAATVVGWSLLLLVAISLLENAGVPWQLSAAVIAVLHAAAAIGCLKLAARLSSNLTLPVVRQLVTGWNANDARD